MITHWLSLFYSVNLELVNLQIIDTEGVKRFLSGGKKAGCFYWLGSEATDKIIVCEGFATGASLHKHTGKSVVIAFDAGNLKKVAEAVRVISPTIEIIIAADNDESGIGEKKAREAALAINGKYIIPPSLGDFNDHLAGGV